VAIASADARIRRLDRRLRKHPSVAEADEGVPSILTGPIILPHGGKSPIVDPTAFIAPDVTLVGDIAIGADSSIWYKCVVRADVNHIRIGARSNIQDGTVVHCDSERERGPGRPTIIGDDVLIGHMAMIHGAILHDRAFVGLGAIVMDAEIESDGMLGAGAMLTPGKRIASGQLWVGRPARYLRDLTEAEIGFNRSGVAHYVENARRHAEAIRAQQATR
jgi:carbonic anhydrase/acetyltransferase-like protein (isoleucine patch superfamily)